MRLGVADRRPLRPVDGPAMRAARARVARLLGGRRVPLPRLPLMEGGGMTVYRDDEGRRYRRDGDQVVYLDPVSPPAGTTDDDENEAGSKKTAKKSASTVLVE